MRRALLSRWPLRTQLGMVFLAVSALPVAVLAILEVRETRGRIVDETSALLAARADQLAGQIDEYHRGYQRSAARLATSPRVTQFLRAANAEQDGQRAQLAARLRLADELDPAVRGVAIIGRDLRVAATSEPALDRRSLGHWRFVRDALAGAAVISDVFVADHSDGDVATIGYVCPVRGPAREVLGAVALWVRAETLWGLVQRAHGLAGPGSFADVLDRDGIRIAYTAGGQGVFRPTGALAPERIAQLVTEQRFGPRTREIVADASPSPDEFARARAAMLDPSPFETGDAGRHHGVGRRLTTAAWTVFYFAPEAIAPIMDATRRHLLYALIAAAIAVIASATFAQRIVAPVRGLTDATERLAHGDLSARVDPSGSHEIAALGRSFNTMADRLHASRTGLEATVVERTAAHRAAELALVASEQRFRDLYENSPDMYMTVDMRSLTIAHCNHTLCERLGYDRAELTGQPLHVLYHADYQPALASNVAELRKHGALCDLERTLRCKDGRSIDASVSVRGVHDRDGQLVEARATYRDITGRKHAERDRQFLVGLSDVLRTSTEPCDIVLSVCSQLAAYLDVPRCFLAEIDTAHDTALIHRDYHRGQASLSGVLPAQYFGRDAVAEWQRGASVVVADATADPRTATLYETAFRPLGIAAALAIPVMRERAWAATLVAAATRPRVWHEREITLVKLVADRLWGWLDHLRVLAELRERNVREAEQVMEARMLRARQDELARHLKERGVLLQEIHHRVKNNLQVISSLINMQVRKLESGSSRDALEECQTRVLAIALIHEKLYQSSDYSEVRFAEYARSLAAGVFHALGVSHHEVALELAIDDIALGVDRAIPCGLVLNELVTNALKHAFPAGRRGTIRVELNRLDDGRIRLGVTDDGRGVPDGFDVTTASSMGLQLITTLAEQLEAELAVTTQPGTSVSLTFAGTEP